MTIHLPQDLENDIIAKVQSGVFASVDAAMAEAVRLLLEKLERKPSSNHRRMPLWKAVEALRKTVPEEEWAKLPADGSAQIDHYIYGLPKRPVK